MNADDLIKLAEDPRFIEGIYNYCDRWCERCAFTSRCLLYAQEAADRQDDDPALHDLQNEKFWEKLKQSMQQVREMIEMYAAENGIDLNAISSQNALTDGWEDHERRKEKAREHQLTRTAERYGFMVKEWFEIEESDVDQVQRGSFGMGNEILPEEFEAAVEVIQWYQFIPAAKLDRALFRVEDGDDEYRMNDVNGSVKVALIAMDRSLLAWSRLREWMPGKAMSILTIMALLENLRLRTEEKFPEARNFIRPGLDEASDYFM